MDLQSFQLCLFLLLLAAVTSSAVHPRKLISRHGFPRRLIKPSSEESFQLPPEYQIHFYKQTLDHFNYKPESYATFQHRYILNFEYWGGANTSSPVFVYTGEEDDVTYDVQENFITDLAAQFNGLVLYIEHRYYGESMPFGSREEAFRNASTLGYLTSEQALADYAQIITYVKKNLSAENSPVIATGASYGGMLAAWFRLKYPHVVIGSLASSSPILYFDDIVPQNGYHSVVTKDFRDASESCYNTIKQSWPEIDKIAAEPNGLLTLSNKFNTCSPINSSQELKSYLEIMYIGGAQYDNPPYHTVEDTCRGINNAPKGTDILGRIFAGINARYFPYTSCHKIFSDELSKESAWDWQTCTEIVMPIGYGENETMFEASPFDMKRYIKDCLDTFGIVPRPHWITTEFGGHISDIKTVLGRFASNIIFSNGLRDPYSIGGVLEDISDSVVAIYTEKGAHCLDTFSATPNDPEWLVDQHDKEIKTIAAWIAQYYAKLSTM